MSSTEVASGRTVDLRRLLGERAGEEGADLLLVLGSGMAGAIDEDHAIELGHLPMGELAGHDPRLLLVKRGGLRLVAALGRRHLYQGYDDAALTELIEEAAAVGVGTVILTNAAGGLDSSLIVGDVVLIDDILTILLGSHLPRVPSAQVRRPIFDPQLNDHIDEFARASGLVLRRGTYVGVTGPCYETPAEIRMLRRMGGTVVGMSTVLEAARAAELGLRVIVLSLVTNVATDCTADPLDHQHVVEAGALHGGGIGRLIVGMVEGGIVG